MSGSYRETNTQRVAFLMGLGKQQKEIAQILSISQTTTSRLAKEALVNGYLERHFTCTLPPDVKAKFQDEFFGVHPDGLADRGGPVPGSREPRGCGSVSGKATRIPLNLARGSGERRSETAAPGESARPDHLPRQACTSASTSAYVNGRPSRRFASSSSNRRANEPSWRQT